MKFYLIDIFNFLSYYKNLQFKMRFNMKIKTDFSKKENEFMKTQLWTGIAAILLMLLFIALKP